jgi:WD40 repeat protein
MKTLVENKYVGVLLVALVAAAPVHIIGLASCNTVHTWYEPSTGGEAGEPLLMPTYGNGECEADCPITQIALQVEIKSKSMLTRWDLSRDGSVLATGHWDHSVILWDPAAMRKLRTLTGHKAVVTAIALSRDGARLISGSSDETARIWDAASGKMITALAGHRRAVSAVSFSADRTIAATGDLDGNLRLWNAENGVELRAFRARGGRIYAVCFSPRGDKCLAGYEDGILRIWDIRKDENCRELIGHTDDVVSMSMTEDGKHMATGSSNGVAIIWRLHDGREIARFAFPTGVVSVSMSPNGNWLAVAEDPNVGLSLWEVRSGQKVMDFATNKEYLSSVGFVGNGKELITKDVRGNLVKWNIFRSAMASLMVRGE